MIPKPRAAPRLGERRLLAASRPVRGVFTRSQLIPGRGPLARLHRGAADAERARAGRRRGRGLRVPRGARCQPVRKCRGTSPAAAPLPAPGPPLPAPRLARRVAGAGRCSPSKPRSRGRAAVACCCCCCSASWQKGGEKKSWAPAPSAGRAGRAGAARAGLGGRAGPGNALQAMAGEPGRRRPDTKERRARNIN